MKYLKTYESNRLRNPQIGDYVLIHIDFSDYLSNAKIIDGKLEFLDITAEDLLSYEKFINVTIGQIIDIKKDDLGKDKVIVKYTNVPNNILRWFTTDEEKQNLSFYRDYGLERVVDFAPTIKELKIKLRAKKYSLK